MTYFLIFLAVVVAAAAALYVVGLNKPAADAPVYDDALAAPVANLPPVLLPRTPAPEDVDRLRFSLGLRGYRMDQVDEVLDRLRDELAAKNLRIAELEGAAAGPPASGPLASGPLASPLADEKNSALKHDAGHQPAAVAAAAAEHGAANGPTVTGPREQ